MILAVAMPEGVQGGRDPEGGQRQPQRQPWVGGLVDVLVNGLLGDHGAAILGARGDMALETPIESDCAPL